MNQVKKINPTNTVASAKMAAAVEQQLTLVRPMQDYLNDGVYIATILRSRIVLVNGKYMLAIDVLATDDEGNESEESFFLKEAFRQPSSTFYKLLEVTGSLPGRGESLDVDALANKRVQITLKNVDKNGSTYTNIVDVAAVNTEQSGDATVTDAETE